MKINKPLLLWSIVLVAVVVLSGCTEGTLQIQPKQKKVGDYRCSVEQLELVERQSEICNKTSYTSSYCYLSAIQSQCVEIIKDDISVVAPVNKQASDKWAGKWK